MPRPYVGCERTLALPVRRFSPPALHCGIILEFHHFSVRPWVASWTACLLSWCCTPLGRYAADRVNIYLVDYPLYCTTVMSSEHNLYYSTLYTHHWSATIPAAQRTWSGFRCPLLRADPNTLSGFHCPLLRADPNTWSGLHCPQPPKTDNNTLHSTSIPLPPISCSLPHC
ncbi:hypothetical protein F7725_002740 [Dissostichus mawsoni]|uniref:Uncharacterized protein n=1 Tax=Dissostichus mawsoni TaxID=36200 RepID=A0A7J5Y880_DISMA|nr:hypothetical protein F7725_002740 [Dissostichus mawsoni]